METFGTTPIIEAVITDTINPGELVRWTGTDGKHYVGTVAGTLGEDGYNCVEADGTTHPGIPLNKVSRR